MRTAWLFPGQGTQKVGMGKELFESSAGARAIFEAADEALGMSLSRLCFEGPDDELTLTANTQPAILATSIAALEALKERVGELPVPLFAAGHSLGEYSALVAAGALRFEDAVRLVRLRGRAMQEAVAPGEGAMAAIMGGEPDAVEQLCADARQQDVLSAANFNAPGQIVIAGDAAAVGRAAELAGTRKLKAIPLKVSAPFHCALMRPAAERVSAALDDIQIGQLRFPVVSNVEGRPNDEAARVRELLVRQVDGPVLWTQSGAWMSEQGLDLALEIGPGKVLAGLMRKIAKGLEVLGAGDLASIDRVAARLTA